VCNVPNCYLFFEVPAPLPLYKGVSVEFVAEHGICVPAGKCMGVGMHRYIAYRYVQLVLGLHWRLVCCLTSHFAKFTV